MLCLRGVLFLGHRSWVHVSGRFVLGRFVLRRFVLRRFVLGRFVRGSLFLAFRPQIFLRSRRPLFFCELRARRFGGGLRVGGERVYALSEDILLRERDGKA